MHLETPTSLLHYWSRKCRKCRSVVYFSKEYDKGNTVKMGVVMKRLEINEILFIDTSTNG